MKTATDAAMDDQSEDHFMMKEAWSESDVWSQPPSNGTMFRSNAPRLFAPAGALLYTRFCFTLFTKLFLLVATHSAMELATDSVIA